MRCERDHLDHHYLHHGISDTSFGTMTHNSTMNAAQKTHRHKMNHQSRSSADTMPEHSRTQCHKFYQHNSIDRTCESIKSKKSCDQSKFSTNDDYCFQYRDHQHKKQLEHHHNVLNSSSFYLIHHHLLNWKFFNCKSIHHSSESSSKQRRHHYAISVFLLVLLSLSRLTSAQMNTCPNAKQINDLKPPNVNLNCDCTQTAEGQRAAGWEIMCYSVENTLYGANNGEYPGNAERSTTLPSTVDRTDTGNRAEMVEEVTSDNLSLSNFGDERVESDNFFAERLSASDGNLEYDELSNLYRSVPIAFTIKYTDNQLVSIECYESAPFFKPAMFQDFKIDEIDSFKILNCALPDVPFSLLFHRTSATTKVPSLRSLRLETLHTQPIDLNQFKKLFVNLESLEFLTIDNYELDTNGKGLRMKRQIAYNRNNGGLMSSLMNNGQQAPQFNRLSPTGQQQNITNSKQFFVNKMHRSTILNNALQNAMQQHNAPPQPASLAHHTGQPINRFKSTPFNFVTPPSSSYPYHNRHFESNRLINVRAIHNNQKPPPFDPALLTTMASTMDTSSMIFRHFDAIANPTTPQQPPQPALSRFNNFNAFLRASRLPNNNNNNHHTTSPNLVGSNSFSPSSFQPSTFPANSPSSPLSFTKFTTPLPPTTTSSSSTTSTTTTTTTSSTTPISVSSTSPSITSTTVRTANSATNHHNAANANDNNLLTSDSRLISNHLPNNALLPVTTNRPLTYSSNLLMSNSSSTFSNFNANNESFIGLENHSQPNRMKTPLLTNMLNKRNNTGRQQPSTNQLGRESTARKLNLNFKNYFPNLKVLKIRSLLTNYDKDNAYFVKEILTDLSSLEKFEFTKNIVYILPNQMFSTLEKLKYLSLSHNQIQQLERDALFNLRMLETLELENNDLKEINEDTFRSLVSLKQIKLRRNKFQALPERLFSRNRNLVEMDLSQNRELVSLPDHLLKNLIQLHNLSVFDCQLNQISSNPPLFFANAPQLRMIYMRNNKLKYLNQRNLFATNSELIKLDLSYNDITNLSPEIFSINSSSLVEFNLYANNLVDVPQSLFTNLKNLKVLNLGFNNLTEVDVSIFYSLNKLEELDLSKNLLTTINPKRYALPFGKGENLRTINLAHNKLTSFANEFGVINWSLYLMLTELNLANNLLQGDVRLPVFYSPQMKLDLRQNQFTTILVDEIEHHERTKIELKPALSDAAKSQVSVFLAGNPISCDCRLFGFVNYTKSANVKHTNLFEKVTFDTEYLECQQPEKLSRTSIEGLNEADLNCPINDAKLCPNACACKYISKYRQVEVDCQQRAMNKPPTKVLMMSNYEEIGLLGSDQKLTNKQIDLISLKFQHNKIKYLDTFNSVLYKNNTVKRRSSPMMLELYLDNNTIDTIPESFLDLALSSLSSSITIEASNATKNRRPTSHPPQNVYLKTMSLTNNQLQYVPVEFLNRVVQLTTSQSKQYEQLPQFKLYLSSNPYNCTPVTQPLSKRSDGEDKWADDECYVKEMKNWLTKNYDYVGDLGDIKCYDSTNRNSSKQLIQYTDEQLCPREVEDKSTTLLLLYICIALTLLLFILTVIYFKNRQTILAFIYIHVHPIFFLCFTEEDLDEEKLYDAFISYSSHDRDVAMSLIEKLEKPSKQTNNSLHFLQSRNGMPTFHEAVADKIVPELNTSSTATTTNSTGVNNKVPTSLKSNNSAINNNDLNSSALQDPVDESNIGSEADYFKLCVHERDWLPGQLISWNIINSVRNSRRTILVLSKSFIDSIWFQIEWHTAYYQMLEDKMDRLIVIVKGELPDRKHLDKDLAYLLSTKTYLVWGEKYFWEKLRYSLPHKKAFKQKNKSIKPLMMNGGNNLKLHDFGTYSTTTPTSLNSLTNRNTLYSNKLSGKNKYMEECINNAISDYYKLDKKTTTTPGAEEKETNSTNRKDNGYDLEKKMKSHISRKREEEDEEDKYAGKINPSFEENETET